MPEAVGEGDGSSLKISTSVPPAPKVMIGPKIGSRTTPSISSRPFRASGEGSIETPLMRALGCFPVTVSMMSW